ncbi:MAG TPA: FtsX-like permease family protein [Bacteroidales bacterium]|nr:FtsX-like permease family protein [Bacteroidales bacterium]
MIHQFRTAIRNLKNSSFASVLNLVGLTSAFTAFILIMVYVWKENHFDSFNHNAENIYRVEVRPGEGAKTSVYLMGLTGKALQEEFPEITASSIYMPWGKWGEETFAWKAGGVENKSFEDFAYSDESLTKIFTFNFIYGNRKNPLLRPETAIVSASFAKKAWGNVDPTGFQIKLAGTAYTITGVFEDFQENSVVRCPIILKIPFQGWLGEGSRNWSMTNYPQFILLKPGTDAALLQQKINTRSVVKSNYNYDNQNKSAVSLVVRPLKDLRFAGDVAENPLFTTNSKVFVNSLFWIGILIILVAFVNYINFATANAPRRIKNISINRVIGSKRFYAMGIIVIETVLLFLASFLVALLISSYIAKSFTVEIFGYTIPFNGNEKLLFGLAIGSLLLGIVASLYPAFYFTSGKLVDIKKRNVPQKKINPRGVLTVMQFAATIVLIALSVLVYKQVQFMKDKNLGFDKGSTLVVRMNNEIGKNFEAFKSGLKASPYITEVACSRAVPGRAQESHTFEVNGEKCTLWYWAVDDKYMDMMGFQLAEGRRFIAGEKESQNIICNETAARAYNWKLGTKVGDGYLVGIMKDFNFVSLREGVTPFAFWYSHSLNYFGSMSIKVSQAHVSEAIKHIKKVYDIYSPETSFNYTFLDDQLNVLYAKESQQAKMISAFSLLSVIVSILGILGLSTFICQFRIKEIGIRKVNGAQTAGILAMLNVNFTKWVIIGFLVACPIAWYSMHAWLQNFAYKTELSWWIFALAGILAMAVALLTVSWQSWRTATRNPVESLRYE